MLKREMECGGIIRIQFGIVNKIIFSYNININIYYIIDYAMYIYIHT
jgi:hypothetical protein